MALNFNNSRFLNGLSLIFFLVDIAIDCLLIGKYYREDQKLYGELTLIFMLIPLLIVNLLNARSYYQYKKDMSTTKMMTLILSSVFLMGPVFRFMDASNSVCEICQNTSPRLECCKKRLNETKKSCLLRLLEVSLKSGPQLVLQLYILVTLGKTDQETDHPLVDLQVIGVLTYWFGIIWAFVAFHLSKDRDLPFVRAILLFLWRLFETAPRLIAFAMHAETVTMFIFGMPTLHWVITYCMYTYDSHPDPYFGTNLDPIIFAIISIFGFFRDRHSKKLTPNDRKASFHFEIQVYYLMVYIENVIMITVWYVMTNKKQDWYYILAFAWVVGGFFLAILCLWLFHYLKPEEDPQRSADPHYRPNTY